MKKKIEYIVLNFGFAEDSWLGAIVYRLNNNKVESEKEALQSLADQLFKCYRASLQKDQEDKEPCLKCGYREPPIALSDSFGTWLVEVHTGTLDQYNSEIFDPGDNDWEIFGYTPKLNSRNSVVIEDEAEEVLAKHVSQDLLTEEEKELWS